jgi:hypothetical protein
MPGRVELRTPNFVHGLVLSPPEGHRRSKCIAFKAAHICAPPGSPARDALLAAIAIIVGFGLLIWRCR